MSKKNSAKRKSVSHKPDFYPTTVETSGSNTVDFRDYKGEKLTETFKGRVDTGRVDKRFDRSLNQMKKFIVTSITAGISLFVVNFLYCAVVNTIYVHPNILISAIANGAGTYFVTKFFAE